MIRSNIRQRVSNYLLAVELLASTLRDLMPLLREHMALLPDKGRANLMGKALDRLDEVLTRVELQSEERES
jgi:hypothetical protein